MMLNGAKKIEFHLGVPTLWKQIWILLECKQQTQSSPCYPRWLTGMMIAGSDDDIPLRPELTILYSQQPHWILWPSPCTKTWSWNCFFEFKCDQYLSGDRWVFLFHTEKKNQCLEFWLEVFIQLQNTTKKNQQRAGTCSFPWSALDLRIQCFFIKGACCCSCVLLSKLHSLAQASRHVYSFLEHFVFTCSWIL